MSNDKIYQHKYICRECVDVKGAPGCVASNLSHDKSPWPPTLCMYGIGDIWGQPQHKWEALSIKAVEGCHLKSIVDEQMAECDELMGTPFVVGCIDYHRGEDECPYPGWWPARVVKWQEGWIFASRGGCDE